MVSCQHCHGSGSEDGKVSTCGTCRGHGRVRMQNGIFSIQQTCPTCGGTGQTIEKPCRQCRGEGRV
jgi:molecular chaperone DnaJ